MLGCARGRVAIVSLLLSHNAAVVTADNAGRTAAMRAQAHRHKEILLLLKRHQQGMLKRNMRDISRPQLVSIQEPPDETRPASPEVPSSPEVPASPREPLPSPPTPKAAAASSTPEDGTA
jgi:ankyrin repeat protein